MTKCLQITSEDIRAGIRSVFGGGVDNPTLREMLLLRGHFGAMGWTIIGPVLDKTQKDTVWSVTELLRSPAANSNTALFLLYNCAGELGHKVIQQFSYALLLTAREIIAGYKRPDNTEYDECASLAEKFISLYEEKRSLPPVFWEGKADACANITDEKTFRSDVQCYRLLRGILLIAKSDILYTPKGFDTCAEVLAALNDFDGQSPDEDAKRLLMHTLIECVETVEAGLDLSGSGG